MHKDTIRLRRLRPESLKRLLGGVVALIALTILLTLWLWIELGQNRQDIRSEERYLCFGGHQGKAAEFQTPFESTQTAINRCQFGTGQCLWHAESGRLAHANAFFHYTDGPASLAALPKRITGSHQAI